jgi:hypothetical protein
MNHRTEQFAGNHVTRRSFLSHTSLGIGSLALATLLSRDGIAGSSADNDRWSGVARPLPHPARAKRMIHLCMAGGPSHLETLDHKPKLAEMHGKPMPESLTKGQQIAQLQGQKLNCFGPQFPFEKYGQSGQEVCSLFPQMGALADDICIVRSMHTDQINHDPAHTLMNTGSALAGRPSMGSWLLYGLGCECDDLPGYVVLTSVGKGGQAQPIAARQWHSGCLPSRFQGVQFQATGAPVLYLNRPEGVTAEQQRDLVNTVNQLNNYTDDVLKDREIATRISQYEMAFRMQASVPELMDLSDETETTLESYGTKGGDGTYASNCLLARRLLERGVRFVQLYHRAWDHHGGIKRSMEITAKEVDQATAALVNDLKQRGLLEDTLIVWGGEFGRTPMAQGSGRDHHIKGFSMWMAGAGIRGGISYGATDELGYNAVEDPFHVRDFHATMLHQFGIDHKRLTYKFQGLDVRLTGVEEAHVVRQILS